MQIELNIRLMDYKNNEFRMWSDQNLTLVLILMR